ncbi:MarR family transcriptional regulator [Kocuria tytonicola]|uniref:MarR family transcriptional regulator n=1 Tax=Kocuria tytonicola TaxID=2055946 RepID=A0A3L9LZ98_9MICC|nr:MarR family transcriptional regulator [Kocuria tytonicola]RLY92323.1 MarR family transcriptional regulator [Kocuria tytonicola]RLZ04421.1 MarR family transcriptional regulator [Kocuria tytonicola]
MPQHEPLPRDPIAEARRNWEREGWTQAAGPMAAVTSIMRAQQLLLGQADRILKPFRLTFSRYEVLALLSFAREHKMLMKKASALLQVHPTSITNAVDRLEDAGLVRREPVSTDRRAVNVALTLEGLEIVEQASRALNEQLFLTTGFEEQEVETIVAALSGFRARSGDFTAPENLPVSLPPSPPAAS